MTTAVKIFSNDGKVQIAASAGQTSLAFDFPIFNENHITVQLTRSNVLTTLVLNTNYTVPLASVGQESGGTVTLVSPALSGDVYTLLLDVPYERTTDFNQAGDFFADTLNLELDLLTQQNQQINRDISSTLRFQTADTPAGIEIPLAPLRAGKYLAFDGSGNVIAADGTGGTPISVPMVPFVQAASLVAAKALLITAGSIATADIANSAVTNAKLANMAADTVKANNTSGSAAPSDVVLAASQLLGKGSTGNIAAINPGTGLNFNGTTLETSSGIQPIVASVASNNLTLTLNATSLEFRSTTLTTGTSTKVALASPASVVVPNGGTLGTVNATLARLVLLAINNAGTIELAVVNIAGGNNLDETTLINTTAVSAASGSNNVIYSTTARTNVAFRVVGFVDISQATAGVWASAPTLVQGCGGNALTSLGSMGYSQTWQDVTGSRALSTTYYNTTGRPITVVAGVTLNNTTTFTNLVVNGVNASRVQGWAGGLYTFDLTAIVPPGGSYSVSGGAPALNTWRELR